MSLKIGQLSNYCLKIFLQNLCEEVIEIDDDILRTKGVDSNVKRKQTWKNLVAYERIDQCT